MVERDEAVRAKPSNLSEHIKVRSLFVASVFLLFHRSCELITTYILDCLRAIHREPTVLESLASTLSTWSPFPSTTGLASNAGSSPSHASTKLPKSSQRDTAELALSSQMGMDEADPSLHSLIGRQEALNEDAEDLTETSNGEAGTSGTPAIVWSGWDRLRSSDGEQMR